MTVSQELSAKDQITTPSLLWAQAARIGPTGKTWQGKPTTCVMCGAQVEPGQSAELAGRKLFGESFNSKLDCHYEGEAVCGHCLALWDKKWLQSSSKAYAVKGEGVYMLARKGDIGSFILQPPEAPYVAVFNTRQQAHMIWRTPVAMPSKKKLQVRVDDEVLVIDRERVLNGVRAWQHSRSILNEVGKRGAKPFILSYDMCSVLMGKPINVHVKAVEAHSKDGKDAVATLKELSLADWWGLLALDEVDVDNASKWPSRRTVDA